MKSVRFVGSSRSELSAFPDSAKLRAGHELFMVQVGREPDDWKPMSSVGAGVCEIRVRDPAGQYRVIYVASFGTAIYVLHAFQKKSKTGIKTSKQDVDLIKQRYAAAKELAKHEQEKPEIH